MVGTSRLRNELSCFECLRCLSGLESTGRAAPRRDAAARFVLPGVVAGVSTMIFTSSEGVSSSESVVTDPMLDLVRRIDCGGGARAGTCRTPGMGLLLLYDFDEPPSWRELLSAWLLSLCRSYCKGIFVLLLIVCRGGVSIEVLVDIVEVEGLGRNAAGAGSGLLTMSDAATPGRRLRPLAGASLPSACARCLRGWCSSLLCLCLWFVRIISPSESDSTARSSSLRRCDER